MSSIRSAFKNQNEKNYGSVEKMYIHFYTILENATSNNLSIYWYSSPTENIELFNDAHTLFKIMKQYSGQQYTGDIFSINNLEQFKENLVLLGVSDLHRQRPEYDSLKVLLQDNTTLEINKHIIPNATHFNDLFDVCFQNYDFHQSFSAVNDDVADIKTTSSLIYVEDIASSYPFYLPNIELKVIAYKVVKTSIDNITLNKWFNTVIKNNDYKTAYDILNNLTNFNKDLEINNNVEDDMDDGLSINESVSTAKISKTDWIKLFCDLYLEEDNTTDILLSDVYQEYVTASSWSDTPTVTMAVFIKQLRALNIYNIKRRSKGMMLIGHTSLVSSQSDFKKKMLNGCLSNRAILKYVHPSEVKRIIRHNEDKVFTIGHKYAREVAFLLYNINIQLNYQIVSQFCSIPQLSLELEKVSKYIDEQIKLDTVKGDTFLNFRKTSDECLVYFPFNKKYYDMSFNNIDLLKTKSFPENLSPFKDNDQLTYYEFGNYGNNAGIDLNWSDSFDGKALNSKSNVGDITSTKLGTTITHRVFKTTKPVSNQQLRKDPAIDKILNGLDYINYEST
jgi:hypothetical protein